MRNLYNLIRCNSFTINKIFVYTTHYIYLFLNDTFLKTFLINKYCDYVKNPFLILQSIHLTEYHIDTKDHFTSIVNSTSNVSISVVKSKIYV